MERVTLASHRIRRPIGAAALFLFLGLCPVTAHADHALCGPELVRLLGDHAQHVFAPKSELLGALVTLPAGQDATALGLEPFTPGYARIHARPGDLVAYAALHPELQIEVAPPLHPLLDQAGQWIQSTEAHQRLGLDGSGVLVGVADTGLDVSLADFRDPTTGKSRVAWLLDLSLPPAGIHADLEQQFCIKGSDGACQFGAVLQGSDIDALLLNPASASLPIDEYGHGTHVTSIAAGNGGPLAKYVGGAPRAQIIFARVVRGRYDPSYSIENDDLLTGVSFLFNRADAMKLPMAANLSIGTDFGPHDGSLSWEKAIASYVGEKAPGRALAVSAGNSGSIVLTPIHQVVHVPSGGSVVSVPIPTPGSTSGTVEIWVTFTPGTSLSVGLDGPDGTWIAPVANGQTGTTSSGSYTASVANGSTATQIPGAPITAGSQGAVVIWDATSGAGWPGGTYAVTLQGEGTADLWLTSAVTNADGSGLGFAYGVREGTINLPATQAGVVSVGCTVNRASWISVDDAGWMLSETPGLDRAGGLAVDGGTPFFSGQVCWFSSAGPTVTGVQKPEISAPGAFVIGAMSSQAAPGTAVSIFTSDNCVDNDAGVPDPLCFEVDTGHAVAEGTSMSAPMVTGGIALMLERDPTLTQGQIVPILQGGAHYFRSGYTEFEDQGGPGELDIVGSLAVMDLIHKPELVLPSAAKSWLTLSTDYLLADGSTPTVAIVELRTADGEHAADLFEASRLQPVVMLNGAPLEPAPTLTRHGPGVWFYSVQAPAGLGGGAITLGATFDGQPIVKSRTIPIATDPWAADYKSEVGGAGSSCSILPGTVPRRDSPTWLGWVGALAAMAARRRVRASRSRR